METKEKEEILSNSTNGEEQVVNIIAAPQIVGSTIQNGWNKFMGSSLFSDMDLVFGTGERIPAHKFVLSSVSPKWRQELLKTSSTKELVIPITGADAIHHFKTLLTAVYTGKVTIPTPEIESLISIASDYGIDPLKESCGDELGKSLSHDNVFFFLDIANKFQCHSLRRLCGKYLAENFGTLMETDSLLTLDLPTWIEVLKNDQIKIKSESEVLKAVVKYAQQYKSTDEKIKALESMLPHVRFPFIATQFLLQIDSDPLLEKVPCFRGLMYQAFKYKSNAGKFSGTFKRRKFGSYDMRFSSDFRLGTGPNLIIEEEGLVIKKALSGHSMAVANAEFTDGVHYWELTIDMFTSGINIGIVVPDKISSLTTYVGADSNSWNYCNTGSKIHQGASTTYGSAFAQGSIIGLLLNLEDGTLTYYVNGKSNGVAFSSLPKGSKFSPAVSLYGNSKVTLNPFAEMPDFD